MIKIVLGTIFGVFLVSPALSIPMERVDLTPINESFKELGKELLRIGLDVIQSAI